MRRGLLLSFLTCLSLLTALAGTAAAQEVSFALASQDVIEGSGTRNVTVNLNPAPTSNITLNYTVGGFATPGSDYTALDGTLPVSAGATTANIPVTVLADSVTENPPSETVVLTLVPGTGYSVRSADSVHTLTIHDRPTATFRYPSEGAREDRGRHPVAVRLWPPATFDLTLNYTVGGTATAGSDYTPLSGSVAISGVTEWAYIPVAIIDDSDREGSETVVLTLADGADYAVGDPKTHRLWIFASDQPSVPTVEFTSSRSSVNEGAGTHDVHLRLSHAHHNDLTVSYAHESSNFRYDTATSGSDYMQPPGQVTVPAGATTATIPVTIIDDNDQEGNERFLLRLTYSEHSFAHYHEVTIVDNEQLPVVSFSSSVARLDEGVGTHNVTLNLSPAPDKDITVFYDVGDGLEPYSTPATSDSDYQSLSGELTVPAGATTATIPVTIIDDGAPEGLETFYLGLQRFRGYTRDRPGFRVGRRNLYTIFIDDDDPQIDVSFASASQSVVEGAGTRDVTVVLTPAPTADITLKYSVSGTASADSDYTALAGSVEVSAGAATATIPVAILDDNDPEGAETVVLTLTGTEGHRKARPSTHTLTIAASDGPPVMTMASFATASQSVGGETGTHDVTVNLNPAPASNITLHYTVGGSATPGSDYTALQGTLAVPAGAAMATIPVTLLADNDQEDRETVVLTLASGTGYDLASPRKHTLTFGTMPTVSFGRPAVAVSESVGTYRAPVHLSPPAPSEMTIHYSTVAPAASLRYRATPGEDFVLPSGRLTVPAGATQAYIPVTIIDDSVEDSRESLVLRLLDEDYYDLDGNGNQVRVEVPPGYTAGQYNRLQVVILNHEVGDLDASIQARLDAAVAGGDSAAANLWRRALAAVRGEAPPNGLARLTQAEAEALSAGHAGRGETDLASLWALIAEVIVVTGGVTDPAAPEVTIAADAASVTEGGGASFTLTADPAPAAALAVTVTVATEGDFGVTAGERTVTVPTTGSATLTLATAGDDVDEADGSVSVTVNTGDGYTVGTTSTGTVAIADDDELEVTIVADAASVTEGTGASFTLTADPAPSAPLDVTVTVAAEGDYGITAGERTVTIPTTGSHELTLATAGDDADEADGSVSATVKTGNGYTVGSESSGTVAIEDDDPPGAVLPAAHPLVKYASLVKSFHDRITARNQHGNGPAGGWNKRFLKAMGHPEYVDYPQAAVTVQDATRLWNHGGPGANTAWDGTVEAVTYAEQYFAGQVTPPTTTPEVMIAAGSGITEGGSASFVLTATPAPSAPLDVTVTIDATGDYGIADATQTVTIPTTGSATLTLATAGDDADEADGSVSVTVDAGTGYTVGSPSSGTVAIADDDEPEVTIAADAASVTEGGSASFTLTADPAPAAPLDVTVTVGTEGDYGITAGERTVTILTTGRTTLTLATTGDEADEADGSVSVTVDAGSGYTVGSASSGTVSVEDDDPPGAVLPAAHPLMKYAPLVKSFYDRITANHQHGDSASGGWNKRFLKAMGHPEYVNYPQAAVTVADATSLWNHGGPGANTAWDGTVEAVTYAEQYFAGQVTPPDPVSVPAVSIAAGADVTEGGSATFILTAAPAPSAPLDVTVTVAATGDYGIADATQTVTIPTTGSATLTLATTGDDADEADGSVSVAVDAGTGYTVGTASSGTVAIADDDLPPPANAAPAVANALPDRTATAGTAFAFQVAANAFTDADGDSLTYSATRADGSALPSWLVFAPDTRTFSGTPPAGDAGTLTVRVTADDGNGGTAADDFDMTVSAPAPAVSIAAGDGVTEGGSASFVLTATPAPSAPLDVTVAIAASGDYGIANATQTVTIPTTGSATLTLATDNDGADEADGSVTATVDAGTGYTVGTPSTGTVAVLDDDVPAIAIAAGADVTEGGEATFTLAADPVPHAPLAVTVALTAEGAYGVTAGERTVTMPVSGTATLTVATTGDDADEPDGSVTATLKAGTGYAVGSASTASVAVRDDDEPVIAAGPSVLTLVARDLNGDAPGHVTEGGTAEVEVRLNPAPAKHVSLYYRTLPGTAWTNHDFRLIRPTRMQFRPGETMKTIRVRTVNDAHDEGLEEFSVRVWPAGGDVTPKVGVIVTVTITNDDPMPAAWLARFGRTVAEQALDGIAGRMAAPRTPGMQGTIAGQALSFDPAASGQPAAGEATMGAAASGHPAAVGAMVGASGTTAANREAVLAMADIARGLGASSSAGPGSEADPFGDRFSAGHVDDRFGTPSLQSRSMTARDALLGSSFSLTGQKDGAGGSLAFWGRASQGSFDGAERGDGTDITLDGTVTTGMLGADYARGNWLIGLALTQSTADGGYAAMGADPCPDTEADLCDGAVRAGDGDVEASLTSAIPYAALRVSERLKLWGAAGYGSGEVTLKTAMGESYSADTSWTMAAGGARSDLLAPPEDGGSGPALALTSDALWARTSSEKTGELAATDSDATRLRLGLEGSWRMALEGDGHLTPKLEIGARHDGGDAETGFGVEVGGGIAWADPGLGLSLDLMGRTLLAHENDDLKDQGFSAQLGFDPAPATQRGPSLSLRQDFGGQARGGLDALFAPEALEDRTGSEATTRWTAEAAYGFAVLGGRFTGSPHAGLGLGPGARDYSVGWRLAPEGRTAPGLSLDLKALRRESDSAPPEHALGIEASFRW